MTVPPCMENTRWIISRRILTISEEQLEMFRALKTNDVNVDYLRDNFRPTQNLNSRKVILRESSVEVASEDDALTILISSVIGIVTFNIVHNFMSQPDVMNLLRSVVENIFGQI